MATWAKHNSRTACRIEIYPAIWYRKPVLLFQTDGQLQCLREPVGASLNRIAIVMVNFNLEVILQFVML